MACRLIILALCAATGMATPAHAQSDPMRACMSDDWLTVSDAQFATQCADLAFNGSIAQRQFLAWAFFVRSNQLIADDVGGGINGLDRVPAWMAWPTDDDTFKCHPNFVFNKTPRNDMKPVAEKKVLAGVVATHEPDGANEEVTRNQLGYDYIKDNELNTTDGVAAYILDGNSVDMPVGSIELKASWLRVPPAGAPQGALIFTFDQGEYWFRGLHIMAKMSPAPAGTDLFYSEAPSWFWTTFEFNDNPGVQHVRENFITQRSPLNPEDIEGLLDLGGIAGIGFENYAPNGTQIRFTVDGNGTDRVILGHTDMEDFAGYFNNAQPAQWQTFEASCHSCHATAAINPETKVYFPFSVPTGALTEQYYGLNSAKQNIYLGDGFVPVDFMWPIAIHARKPGTCE